MLLQPPFLPVWGSVAPGTEIRTSRGDVAVEMLTPGDRIIDDDGDEVVLRQVGCHRRRLYGKSDRAKLVMIRAGALGGDLPYRDLILAPGQRVAVVDSAGLEPVYAEDLLVPAAGLTGRSGVRRMRGRRRITLFSLVFDRPCLFQAEGCVIEGGQGLIGRWVNDATGGWIGAVASRWRNQAWPRMLSVNAAAAIADRLRADSVLPEILLQNDQRDLLEWDQDLADERRHAEELGRRVA